MFHLQPSHNPARTHLPPHTQHQIRRLLHTGVRAIFAYFYIAGKSMIDVQVAFHNSYSHDNSVAFQLCLCEFGIRRRPMYPLEERTTLYRILSVPSLVKECASPGCCSSAYSPPVDLSNMELLGCLYSGTAVRTTCPWDLHRPRLFPTVTVPPPSRSCLRRPPVSRRPRRHTLSVAGHLRYTIRTSCCMYRPRSWSSPEVERLAHHPRGKGMVLVSLASDLAHRGLRRAGLPVLHHQACHRAH
jgi:hypothetical protein